MTAHFRIGLLIGLAIYLGAALGCASDPQEVTSQVSLNSAVAVRLPPGHPGTVSGSTLLLPAEATTPIIHYANCFAGVSAPGDLGIGSAAGYTQDYIASFTLPINANLGAANLGSYRVRVTVGNPAVEIYIPGIVGSYSWLSSTDCRSRGCASVCVQEPAHYPPQFNRAFGFETTPLVAGTAAGVTIEAVNGDLANPTTGTVNLANVAIRIVGDLPPSGVIVSFSVDLFKDTANADLATTPFSGTIIEKFQIQ